MTSLLDDLKEPLGELWAELAHLRGSEEGIAVVQGNLPALAAGYAFAATLDQTSRVRIRLQDSSSATYRQIAGICPWALSLRERRGDMLRAAALLMLAIARDDAAMQEQMEATVGV